MQHKTREIWKPKIAEYSYNEDHRIQQNKGEIFHKEENNPHKPRVVSCIGFPFMTR
jgi:protein-disulfide isomerase-like protein with CxxC motif